MLSRVAHAPGLALVARACLSRPALSPILGARAAATPLSPWIRTYARSGGRHKQNQQPGAASRPEQRPGPSDASREAPEDDAPRDAAAPEAASDKDAPRDATLAGQPRQGNVGEPAQEAAEQIPLHKLPDLTQGIPSTLDQELRGSDSRPQSALQAVEPSESQLRGPRERRDSYIPSSERNRRWWTRFMLLTTAVGTSFAILYQGRNWDDSIDSERHPDIPNGWSPWLWWQRVKARMGESVSYYQDPAFDKLLPDPDPSFERPYTLCLSLDDFLVHSEWSREHGWRVAKRPGMDYFVRYLSQYYELVLFTTVPFLYGEPLVRKLDPFRFIMWPLYREATKYEDGEIVKDLSYLNRDLSKVIIIDTKAAHVRKHPENAIILEPWKGDAKDKGLVSLIPFLEYIHTMQYSDVRKVIKSFEGKDIATEFARREAIARQEFHKQLDAQKSKRSKPSGMGALGNLLGLKPSNMSMTMAAEGEQNPSEAFAQGKMLQDIARERGQRTYEMLEKEIRENGDKWLKEEQVAMEKAQKEAMTSVMGSFNDWFKPPNPGAAGTEKKA